MPTGSEVWRKDLTDQKHHWFYMKVSHRRCLLVPYSIDMEKYERDECIKQNKVFWKLGAVIVN